MSRTPFLLALAAVPAALAGPALAGGYGCGGAACYRQEYVPPSYGTVAERVMVRAPRTYSYVTPPQYGYVSETVKVAPARRYWTVKHDHYGRKIGCWVTEPAQYAQVQRKVMVRGPEVVPQYVPAEYAIQHRTVLTHPGYKTWVPLGGGYRSASYGYGSGYGGGYRRASYGYGDVSGHGFAGRSYGYGGGSYGYGYGGGLVGAGFGAAGAAVATGLGVAGAGLGYGEF